MFQNYSAQKEDLKTINKTLHLIAQEEFNFIFSNKKVFQNITVLSFDSNLMYLWTKREKRYSLKKIPHNLKMKDVYQSGWRAILKPPELKEFIPKKLQGNRYEQPKISGGLLTPFIGLQKKKERPNNPYTTKESYMATILHEFGHIYFDLHNPWWYADKEENLHYFKLAQKLFEREKKDLENLKIRIPYPRYFSEIFAFCTEYKAAEKFWPDHQKRINKYAIKRIAKLKEKEKKNFDYLNPNLQKSPHDFGLIIGKLVLEKFPKKWPEVLIKKPEIKE